MLHISVITSLQTDIYIDELVKIFLKLSMKTVQVHLIIGTTFSPLQNHTVCCSGIQHIYKSTHAQKVASTCGQHSQHY